MSLVRVFTQPLALKKYFHREEFVGITCLLSRALMLNANHRTYRQCGLKSASGKSSHCCERQPTCGNPYASYPPRRLSKYSKKYLSGLVNKDAPGWSPSGTPRFMTAPIFCPWRGHAGDYAILRCLGRSGGLIYRHGTMPLCPSLCQEARISPSP